MGWKDKMSEQHSVGTAYPDFLKNLQGRFEIKGNEKGQIAFSYWDKEAKLKKFSTNKMEGALIGSAMKLSAYDASIGKNGGTITSSTFFNYKDKGVAFSEGSKIIEGVMADVKAFILQQSGGCKTLRVYYVLTQKGVYEIATNISFSILETSRLEPNVFASNMAVLTPTEYNPDDPQFDKTFQKILGPFASKNRPKYASISPSMPITDAFAEATQLEMYIDKYNEWKEFTTNQGADEQTEGFEKSKTSEAGIEEARENHYSHTIDDVPPPVIEGEDFENDDLSF